MGSVRIVEKGSDLSSCTDLSYRLVFPAADFDIVRFGKEIGKQIEPDDWKTAYLGARSSEAFPFHAHVYWKPEPKDSSKLMLQVDYHKTAHNFVADPNAPFAEEFFKWVGPFFSVPIVNFHLHVEFAYPRETCQVKILPLPLKVPYDGKSASVDGVLITIPASPEGVGSVWINITKKQVELELHADRRMEFKDFQIEQDIKSLSSVAASLVEI